MRYLPVALALAGCTEPNDFFVPVTESSSTSSTGTTTSASTTTPAPTSTDPSTDPSTSPLTDPSTDPTSGTTLPATNTSEGVTSTGSTSAGVECPEYMETDFLGELRHKDDDSPLPPLECSQLSGLSWAAKYVSVNGSLYFVPNQCPNAPGIPISVRLSMPAFNAPPTLHGLDGCVIVTMTLEPEPGACILRVLTIADMNGEFAWGEFGVLPGLPALPVAIGFEGLDVCGTEAICAPAPQPGGHRFVVNGELVPEGGESFPDFYHFWNLRSHVDGTCIGAPDPTPMIHFDYFLSKEP